MPRRWRGVRHEYIVRGMCLLTEAEFLYIVVMQRCYEISECWGQHNYTYQHIDGYKYRMMGGTYENTIIINRAKE